MSDPVHDAILELVDDMIARMEDVRSENRDLRQRLDELERRTAGVETRAAEVEVREGPQGPAGEPGERGADGRGIEAAELRGGDLIFRFTDGVEANVGRVTGEQGPPGEQGERGSDGADGKNGRDGTGVERVRLVEGRLEIRLTDGQELDLGRVVGERGERGEKGADGRDGEPGARGERGETGPAGRDGADGIATREELEALVEERFRDVQARNLADIYRGVFSNGDDYVRGDVVTCAGSLWLALADTRAKPGSSEDWRLIAKKGRDGRDRT